MNKYNVTFKFNNSWFTQHCFNDEFESKLNIKQFANQLQNQLIKNKEQYRVIKVNKVA